MKIDHKDITNLLLFICVVILLFIVIVKIGKEGTQCTLNPLEFGANQLREQNNKEIMCSCNLITDMPSPTLHFNHNSSRFVDPPRIEVEDYMGINISVFENLIVS